MAVYIGLPNYLFDNETSNVKERQNAQDENKKQREKTLQAHRNRQIKNGPNRQASWND